VPIAGIYLAFGDDTSTLMSLLMFGLIYQLFYGGIVGWQYVFASPSAWFREHFFILDV